jgi:hypothetical protein
VLGQASRFVSFAQTCQDSVLILHSKGIARCFAASVRDSCDAASFLPQHGPFTKE